MSSKVISKTLPHGTVPFSDIVDGTLRNKIMLLNENITSLASQLQEAQKALRELQANGVGGAAKSDEEVTKGYMEQAKEYASTASTASTSAQSAAKSASASETNASTSKSSAASSASQAEASATSAANSAASAASSAASVSDKAAITLDFRYADLGINTARSTFYLSDYVYDTSKTYSVTVKFTNQSSNERSCKINDTTYTLASGIGETISGVISVAGTGSFTVDNIAYTVSVLITIKPTS